MVKRFDSYCGLYCGACKNMNPSQNYGATPQMGNDQSPNLECQGCKSSESHITCNQCEIRICAQAKGIEWCSECPSYPCKMLLQFKSDKNPHHSAIIANLEDIKNFGVAEWLSKQKYRWTCPKCDTRFSWYEKKCEKCGEDLYNCRKEEKDILMDELSKLPLFFAL